MKSTIVIKSLLAPFFLSSGIISTKIRNRSAKSLILMYHRVISRDEAGEGVQAGMYVEPETFKVHVQFLLKYFKIVSIFELYTALKNKTEKPEQKPLCILTFDDGWFDFYKYAFPILKTHSVPATVFLPTDFVGTSKWFWTDRLMHLFIQRVLSTLPAKIPERSPLPLVNQLEDLNGSLESRTERGIAILKACRTEQIEQVLSELSTRWNLDPTPRGRAFLSWEEVREMKKSGLISFGSHTAGHGILTTFQDDEIQDELAKSKNKLITENAVDPSFIPFCYPNGNYNETTVKLAQEAGYNLAVTTENEWNLPGLNPLTLKRIAVHQDMTSNSAMLGCRITGIF